MWVCGMDVHDFGVHALACLHVCVCLCVCVCVRESVFVFWLGFGIHALERLWVRVCVSMCERECVCGCVYVA